LDDSLNIPMLMSGLKKIKRMTQDGTQLVASAVGEVGANLVALQMYPLGVVNSRRRGVPHSRTCMNPRPIILVHGVVHNHSAFWFMKRRMKALGWQNIYSINYSTFHGSLTGMVEQLSKTVEEVRQQTHSDQVDIVAHSLGGIVSRYYMTIGAGRGRVKNLVTLGTSHLGTNLSFFLRGLVLGGSLHWDLRSESYLMKTLSETALPEGSKITSIYCVHDQTVWPRGQCLCQGEPKKAFKNLEVKNVGHLGLLYSRPVFDQITDLLVE